MDRQLPTFYFLLYTCYMSYIWNPEKVTYFAMTDIRAQRKAFGIKQKDRDRHMYIIGKTGMGKSTLLENLAIQDIQNGEGICFIDPHGSTAEKLLDFVPHDRIKDVMYFAPFDVSNPIAFNVMEDVGYDKRHLVASGLMSAFHRIWGPETWSARMEYILQNTLLALLETPDTTLMDVNRLLSDNTFRKKVVKNVTDPIVRRYWEIEFAQYTDRYKQEAVPAIQNKIGQFVSNPLTRNIIAQPKSSFDMREMMDSRKIVIINLSKGRIGEQNADLLGSLLVVKIYLAAMSRAELPKKEIEKLPKFFLYIDEFQSVVNDSFANILSEARKYGLCMTIAHQYVEQMPEEVAAAVFGNVGTTISFRIGPNDAETLEKMFDPTFTAQDLVGLGFAQIYLSLMIDGVGSRPFSAQTLGPIEEPVVTYVKEILAHSKVTYGKPRKEVEEMINGRERGLSAEFKGNSEGMESVNYQRRDAPPRRDDDRARSAPRSDRPRDDRPRDDRRDVRSRDGARSDTRSAPQSSPRPSPVVSDIPRPIEMPKGVVVGPIVKEEMPLVRRQERRREKGEESNSQNETALIGGFAAGSVTVPKPATSPEREQQSQAQSLASSADDAEKTRNALKAALDKFAQKEKERAGRTGTPPPQEKPAERPTASLAEKVEARPVPPPAPAPTRAQPHDKPHAATPVEQPKAAQPQQLQKQTDVRPKPTLPPPVKVGTASAPKQHEAEKSHAIDSLAHQALVDRPTPALPKTPPPVPPASPAPAQKSAEEIELEALRALLADDE